MDWLEEELIRSLQVEAEFAWRRRIGRTNIAGDFFRGKPLTNARAFVEAADAEGGEELRLSW
jgi:hypothetical protein